MTNHSLTLGLLSQEFKPPFELEIFEFEQQDIPLSIIVWVIICYKDIFQGKTWDLIYVSLKT